MVKTFYVLPPSRNASHAARGLTAMMRAVPAGNWSRLFSLANKAREMETLDRLYVFQCCAEITQEWWPTSRTYRDDTTGASVTRSAGGW